MMWNGNSEPLALNKPASVVCRPIYLVTATAVHVSDHFVPWSDRSLLQRADRLIIRRRFIHYTSQTWSA